MKRIAFFCISVHGHTNPMLPVAAKLVGRGNTVRFYSFKSKIEATGAAEFIENAPHPSEGVDVLSEINKANGKFLRIYWLSIIIMIAFIGVFISRKYMWIVSIVGVMLSLPIGRSVKKKRYDAIIKKINGKKNCC